MSKQLKTYKVYEDINDWYALPANWRFVKKVRASSPSKACDVIRRSSPGISYWRFQARLVRKK